MIQVFQETFMVLSESLPMVSEGTGISSFSLRVRTTQRGRTPAPVCYCTVGPVPEHRELQVQIDAKAQSTRNQRASQTQAGVTGRWVEPKEICYRTFPVLKMKEN